MFIVSSGSSWRSVKVTGAIPGPWVALLGCGYLYDPVVWIGVPAVTAWLWDRRHDTKTLSAPVPLSVKRGRSAFPTGLSWRSAWPDVTGARPAGLAISAHTLLWTCWHPSAEAATLTNKTLFSPAGPPAP